MVIYSVCSRQTLACQNARDTVRMNMFNWPVPQDVNEQTTHSSPTLTAWWGWAKRTDLHIICACARQLHPSILRPNRYHLGLTNSALPFCILTKMWTGNVFRSLIYSNLRLMSAWIAGDFLCWMGKRRLWIFCNICKFKWRKFGDCSSILSSPDPIHLKIELKLEYLRASEEKGIPSLMNWRKGLA